MAHGCILPQRQGKNIFCAQVNPLASSTQDIPSERVGMDEVDRNGRLHWLHDDYVIKLIISRVPYAITLRICRAVCRKWHQIVSTIEHDLDIGNWWDGECQQFIRSDTNTEADMRCLEPFFRRNSSRSKIDGYAFHTALRADRPSVARMCLSNDTHLATQWTTPLRLAIEARSVRILEEVLVPVCFIAKQQMQVFNQMMRFASFDLFRWYCNRYKAMRGFEAYEGFSNVDIDQAQEIEAKIQWMASASKPADKWSQYFWAEWFTHASGISSRPDREVYNDEVAVYLVKHVFKTELPGGACSHLTDFKFCPSSQIARNLALHERLRRYCGCVPSHMMEAEQVEPVGKKPRVEDD